MAFIPAPNILRVAVEYLLDGQVLANVFHVNANETIDAIVTEAILDIFEAWLTVEWMPDLADSIQATGLVGKDLTTITGAQVNRAFTPTIPGESASPALPNNVALCLTWFTGLAGRSFRGRTYMPGMTEGNVVLSEVDEAALTEFLEGAIDLVNQLDTAGYTLVVTSYQAGGAPRVTAVSTPITGVGANAVVDSQRRRLPGRGT